MATTWKLNNNLLLLSAKRARSLRSSLCRLQFGGANSNVSGFKVESLRLNSSSSSRLNNNVPLSDKVETFDLNKKNAAYPLEVALSMLKSKVPSLVMASCLMLGMMMINCHKPAFARTPFSSSPAAAASASVSSSSATGCPLCLNGCIFCLKLPASSHISAKESPYRHSSKESPLKFLEDIIHIFMFGTLAYGLALLFGVVILVYCITSSSSSIFMIQVGLLFTKDLQRDLNLITTTLEKCTSSAWNTILEDVIEVLDWHRNNWKFGYSYGNIFWRGGREYFWKLSYEEGKRFDKKMPLNLRNVNTISIANSTQLQDEFKNTYMVVTLLVAFSGRHKLPTIRERGDLDQVLKKLKSYNSKTNQDPEGVDVLCAPEKGNEIMSLQQLKKNYPLLKPI